MVPNVVLASFIAGYLYLSFLGMHFVFYLSLSLSQSFPGAYTPGLRGVRRTPCETEHDVTFSRSCHQVKSTKNLER